MQGVEALEAWKCLGAQRAILTCPEDLLDKNKLVEFGKQIGAVVHETGNGEIIFLQGVDADRSKQRAFRLEEFERITFRDL